MYVSAVVEQPPTPGGRLNKNEKDKVSSIKEIIKSIRIVKWLQVEGEMKSPIRKGDKLEHGGEVTAGSPWTTFMSQPLARKGDAAHCNLHGSTFIDEGANKFPDRDGKLFALDGHRCACGCRLISSLPNVNFE